LDSLEPAFGPATTKSVFADTEPVGPAYPPVAAMRSWEVEDDDEPATPHEPKSDAAEPDEEPEKPALRVVAEAEDDLPEIEWKLPSIALLDTVTARRERMADEIKRNVKIIESTLETFGVSCKVVGVNPGPAVTQYELQPGPGVQVKRITALQNDLSLALAAAPLRLEAPIPGKSAVGIEVPNKAASLVTIREVLETATFREGTHMLALAPDKQGFYNLGNGDGYSVRQVIRMCEKVSGKKIPAIERPRRPGDPPKLVASAEKAIRELGWKPQFPKLEDIVTTAWEWHKKNPAGYAD